MSQLQNQPPLTQELIQKELVKSIWKNEGLRAEIAKDPKGSIERILGIKFPESLKVRVIDQTEGSVYFVLPHHPNDVYGFELTEDQLDKVAGGISVTGISPRIGAEAGAIGFTSGTVDMRPSQVIYQVLSSPGTITGPIAPLLR